MRLYVFCNVFNIIFLKGFLGSIWCMYKDIVLIFLFSFLRINNMMFFNGFVNVLNLF